MTVSLLAISVSGVAAQTAEPGTTLAPGTTLPPGTTAPAGTLPRGTGTGRDAVEVPGPPPPTVPSVLPPMLVPPAIGTRPPATFELHPSITLSEEYTDNFRRRRRDTEENFRTSLTPGATLLINGARTQGQLSGSFSLSHDSATDEIRTLISSALGGTVTWQPTPRTFVTLSDFFRRSDDPELADDLSLRRERRSFTSNVFTAAAGWMPGTVSTQAYYRLATFFNDDAELGDTISHAMGVTAGIPLGQLASASAGYEFLLSDGSNSELTGHQFTASLSRRLGRFASAGVSGSYAWRTRSFDDRREDEDFTIWSVSVFTGYALPGRWSLSGNVGYSELDSTDARRSRSSITTQSTLAYQFARGSAYVSVTQGFSETFVLGEDVGVVETRGVTVGVSYPLTVLIWGSAQGFYRENTFTGIGRGLDGTEEVWGARASVSVPLRSWLSMSLSYGHTEWSSGPRGEGFSENRVTLSLTAGY
ncbi:MAG TPA: outer membrane beta-barrel protein [Candidatus Tectomicrobia bacterium]|nr:outer membrane beta-barrel protein [Candidatus Tectomicrobia bacterium]